MAQPKIPGTDIIKPVMPFGSDGSDWIALLVSGLGALQVELASLPTGAATIADGADVMLGALADAVVAAGAVGSVSGKLRRLTTDLDALLTELKLKADLTETQPTSVEGFDPVPSSPVLEYDGGINVNNTTWTTVGSYTVTEGKTFYVTDIYASDEETAAGSEFIVVISIEGATKIKLHIPAGNSFECHFTTPVAVLSEQVVTVTIYQWSGGALDFGATIIGFEL